MPQELRQEPFLQLINSRLHALAVTHNPASVRWSLHPDDPVEVGYVDERALLAVLLATRISIGRCR